jgi:DNA repair exonuclease SbcCD ATPase subunit
MILFKNIRWKNFLSTGNQYTEVDFTENKTNLIVGTNGAGKSTVLDALTFSLFHMVHSLVVSELTFQLMKNSSHQFLEFSLLHSD